MTGRCTQLLESSLLMSVKTETGSAANESPAVAPEAAALGVESQPAPSRGP